MNYVPEGYDYEQSPMIRILLFNGIGQFWEILQMGQIEFLDCPVNKCMFTIDQSLGSEIDVVLFRHLYKTPEWKRPPHQVSCQS